MSFLRSMDIAASGLTAQRLRLDIISENVTNINTTRTEGGGPYRRKTVALESKNGSTFGSMLSNAYTRLGRETPGVRVAEVIEDQTPFKLVYDPEHPDAGNDGYVRMPNVDLIKEMVDSMAATRAYEANITAINAVKSMASKALTIGK